MAWATPAAAQNLVAVQVSNTFVQEGGFDAFSSNDSLTQLNLYYGRQLLRLGPGELWVDGEYLVGAKQSDLFGYSNQTDLLAQSFVAGACYKLPLWSWLVPRLRLGAGVLVGRMEMDLGGEHGSGGDWAAAASGHALAGVELLWPRSRRARVNGGLVVEAGYGWSSALSFAPSPEPDEDLQQIPLRGVGWGGLNLYGAQLRVGAAITF